MIIKKILNNIIFVFFIMFFFFNCKHEISKDIFIKPETKKDYKIFNLHIDTLILEKVESSYLGFTRIINNNICFIDQKFCWFFLYNKEGKYLSRYLGQGNGPKELSTGMIDGYEILNNGDHFFIGSGRDCHIYNKEFVKKKTYIVKNTVTIRKENELKKQYIPSPDNPYIYTLTYLKLIIRDFNDYLYFTIYSEYPTFNFIFDPLRYFKKCHLLFKININDGSVEKIIGNYSQVYVNNFELKQFSLINFDISKQGTFYISFEADSLIYVYDKNFKIKKAFGIEGRDMNKNYKNLKTIEEFKKFYLQQREECGYYTWLEYIDERDLLFRSYQKGKNSKTDGLQIYKDNVLIGDIDVPKGFKVDGYIYPYIYSHGIIDEEKEIAKIYRFKID